MENVCQVSLSCHNLRAISLRRSRFNHKIITLTLSRVTMIQVFQLTWNTILNRRKKALTYRNIRLCTFYRSASSNYFMTKTNPNFEFSSNLSQLKRFLVLYFSKSTKNLIGPTIRKISEFVFGCVWKQFFFLMLSMGKICKKKSRAKNVMLKCQIFSCLNL